MKIFLILFLKQKKHPQLETHCHNLKQYNLCYKQYSKLVNFAFTKLKAKISSVKLIKFPSQTNRTESIDDLRNKVKFIRKLDLKTINSSKVRKVTESI